MDQSKPKSVSHEGQFEYLGRWLDKSTFRAFVYDDKGNQVLANTYQEFEKLTHSGLWFASKDIAHNAKKVAPNQGKPKHDTVRSNS